MNQLSQKKKERETWKNKSLDESLFMMNIESVELSIKKF
jgi:hypothetical protein